MSKVHAILSDLHRILSTYESEEIIKASNYPGLTPALRDALISIASETSIGTQGQTTTPRKRVVQSKLKSLDLEITDEKSALVNTILNSNYGGSVASLRQFVSGHSLKLNFRQKESRERIAGRLANLMLLLPESKRYQLLADMLGEVSNQTQGWINVIKGKKS